MMKNQSPFADFVERLKFFASRKPQLLTNALSNVFSMRRIGNKTHGDMAEIGIVEFVNQFLYDYRARHVGKDLFRNKVREEDIEVECLVGTHKGAVIPISLKAYGAGSLQISTDKEAQLFCVFGEFEEKGNS